ncbi:hypothetical protein ACQCVP_18030 [Rossellomorea vietnamensis]
MIAEGLVPFWNRVFFLWKLREPSQRYMWGRKQPETQPGLGTNQVSPFLDLSENGVR